MTAPPVLRAVRRATRWRNNGEMIRDIARVGWLHEDDIVLDPTYGRGTFWSEWQPKHLTRSDARPSADNVMMLDFRHLPFPGRSYDVVVFDPPYKLNGRPDAAVDERFGVHERATVAQRYELIYAGLREAMRIASKRILVKCQDQVCNGEMHWQTDDITDFVAPRFALDPQWRKADRFDFLGGREQPFGRSQQHARANYSTMLVFVRADRTFGWRT
jgi:hypothetical protein